MSTGVIDKQAIKPLYLQIRESLLHQVEKNPSFRFPSERELCTLYGVSRPTVQKALSYFLERNLIVRRPGVGTMLCKGKSVSLEATTAVKIIVPNSWSGWEDSLYFSQILAGVMSCLHKDDHQLTIQKYTDKVKHLLLKSPEICSLWVSPGTVELEAMKMLVQNELNVISINRKIDYPNISYITTDHEYGAKVAIEYLLDRGHKDILFIGSLLIPQINNERYQGYLSAFQSRSIYSGIAPLNLEIGHELEGLESKLPKILNSTNRPTAIFLSRGAFQKPVIKILNNLGLLFPKDISIISFDNVNDVSEKYGITVIQQQLSSIGRQAYKAIFQKETIKMKVETRIFERKSVK